MIIRSIDSRIRTGRMLAMLSLCALLIGCFATPLPIRDTVEIATGEYARMYQGAIEVLQDEGLQIAAADYRFGRITSAPWVAPTLGEAWRRPRGTLDQSLQNSLNQQRRVVAVTIEQADVAEESAANPLTAQRDTALQGEYVVRVRVTIEQLQVPTRYLTGSTAGRQVFGHLGRVQGITKAYWSPVGQDPILARHLLEQIIRRSVSIQSPRISEADIVIKPDTTEPAPTDELTEELEK
jgi:hypothetical protein